MTTFKIYKEKESKTEPEVYLKLIRDCGVIRIVAVNPETGGVLPEEYIASFESDGTLTLSPGCDVPGIKTDGTGRIIVNKL